MAAHSHIQDRQHTVPETEKLRNAVEFIDALSQEGFSGISSIAKLALSRLETPEGARHLDDIANALKAIWHKADEVKDCINFEAESAGCNYVDNAEERRRAAFREARGAEV